MSWDFVTLLGGVFAHHSGLEAGRLGSPTVTADESGGHPYVFETLHVHK